MIAMEYRKMASSAHDGDNQCPYTRLSQQLLGSQEQGTFVSINGGYKARRDNHRIPVEVKSNGTIATRCIICYAPIDEKNALRFLPLPNSQGQNPNVFVPEFLTSLISPPEDNFQNVLDEIGTLARQTSDDSSNCSILCSVCGHAGRQLLSKQEKIITLQQQVAELRQKISAVLRLSLSMAEKEKESSPVATTRHLEGVNKMRKYLHDTTSKKKILTQFPLDNGEEAQVQIENESEAVVDWNLCDEMMEETEISSTPVDTKIEIVVTNTDEVEDFNDMTIENTNENQEGYETISNQNANKNTSHQRHSPSRVSLSQRKRKRFNNNLMKVTEKLPLENKIQKNKDGIKKQSFLDPHKETVSNSKISHDNSQCTKTSKHKKKSDRDPDTKSKSSNQSTLLTSPANDSACGSQGQRPSTTEGSRKTKLPSKFENRKRANISPGAWISKKDVPRPFQCPTCDYAAMLKGALKDHQIICAKKKEKLSHRQCPYCEFNSLRSGNVSRHIRIKHQDKPLPEWVGRRALPRENFFPDKP